jgi:hypothetical protein
VKAIQVTQSSQGNAVTAKTLLRYAADVFRSYCFNFAYDLIGWNSPAMNYFLAR